jgi:Family of unknown function (DUF6526)
MAEQNIANHTKFSPPFHFFVMPVLLINLFLSIMRVVRFGVSEWGVFSIVLAFALILGFLSTRRFALSVQDRVIRLEERLRYQRLLPADLQSRIDEFTLSQLISLRFASDAELPSLARQVLEEKLQDRKAIKRMIKNWRADYLRA